MKQVLLYLPVIHRGYDELLVRHRDADEILLLGNGFAEIYAAIGRERRALPPDHAAEYLQLIADPGRIRIIEPADLPDAVTADTVVVPDEELMRGLAVRYGLQDSRNVVLEKTFLHWDREWSRPRRPEGFGGATVTQGEHRQHMAVAQRIAEGSSDWWRRIGAIAVRDGAVLGSAFNRHQPTEYSPYVDGDPRDAYSRGVRADLSTAIHAEAAIIAQAAQNGVPLRGADLYVTTFPCPTCAQLIAAAGFRRCYFSGPYSVPAGDDLLRRAGIEVTWVDTHRGAER